ncbi:Ger(x)C family spore germination protein [Clostridium sp. AWRP]|uniref:Ger(x)C family spore germination protein n=1 Tax=Clostridium sp. AWRP TaxID=2212991 RepID=UPI000FDAFDB3|nr:Ger(x)C family spore germination protein [Clostridium sp. AWRP]AZV58335.1 Ger(x)C family spore germination protein [Clostridium sp. AWRP]
MKYKSTLFYILIFTFSISLYGCSSDKSELNEINVVAGIGIDKISSNNTFLITLEIINPSHSKGDSTVSKRENKSIIQVSTGHSIFSTMQNFSKNNPVLLDFSHAKVIILSRELCESESEVSEVMDYLSRNRQIRSTSWIFVSNKPAREILQSRILGDSATSTAINSMMTLFKKNGPIVPININNFIIESKNESKSTFAPVIDIEKSKDSTAAKITVERMAIFKNNHLMGILTSEESKSLLWIVDYAKGHEVIFPIKSGINDNVTIDVFKKSDKIIPHLTENGINTEIQCSGTAFIEETQNINISPEAINNLQYNIESTLESQLNKLIYKSQKDLNTDFIGFSTKIYNNNPKEWINIKKNWSQIFPNIKYEINFKIKVTNIGIVKDPVITTKEENSK